MARQENAAAFAGANPSLAAAVPPEVVRSGNRAPAIGMRAIALLRGGVSATA